MNHTISRITFLASLALAVPAGATTVFWVAPDGRDNASGSIEQPFATVGRAREAVRTLVQRGLADDVAVRLRGGVYRLEQPLEITAEDVGDGRLAVAFTVQRGERAVLVGSRELTGPWHRMHDNLWSMAVPDAASGRWVFRSLFRDGQSLPRGREPNSGYFTVAAVDAERMRLTLNERLPAAWSGLQGVELNTTAHWHFNRQPVAALTKNSVLARRPIGTDVSSARITEKSHSRVWLENALVFVDAPGEWFLDTVKGELFYFARPGEDPNQGHFSAARLRELVIVRGSPEKPVRNLHFRGLEFAETDWEMPAEGRLGVQAGAWAFDRGRTYSPDAALRLIYATGCSIQSCVFRDLGDGAIAFETGCNHGLVSRCDFRRVGSNGIQVGRMPEYTGEGHPLHADFKTPREKLDAQKTIPGAVDIYRDLAGQLPAAPAQIDIADNTLVDCGTLDFGSVGIVVGYAHHVRIEHNLLRNLPYTGISVGWRWAPGLSNAHSNLIARNRIEQVMQQAGDGGGIYLVGEQPGTRVLENFIRDSGRNYWSHGIYPDEFSDHMEIAGNYITAVTDHAIFMNKNGPNQSVHDNNGAAGPNRLTGENDRGGRWIDFAPENLPPVLSVYGPRQVDPAMPSPP
ncbi:MAG: right-handed parallel beta-helix repeat-containing protein [Opitutus sp.]|nr:right-handed parallel beta-helix repeat-containing protein [Opitutus sp.]